MNLTLHWTAGYYAVTANELAHYHFLIDGEGRVHQGKFTPEQNMNPQSGQYAAHVKGANTNNIGVALCGMADAHESDARRGRYGNYPVTFAAFEEAIRLCADLCRKYEIPVVPARLLAHEEWDTIHGRPQDRWDVCCVPHLDIRPRLNADGTYDSMNWFRGRVAALLTGAADDFKPLFAHIVAMFDEPAFSLLPVETQRQIKQLRYATPFDKLERR